MASLRVRPTPQISDGIELLLSEVRLMEGPHKRKNIAQGKRCQDYGHCNYPARYVNPHRSVRSQEKRLPKRQRTDMRALS